MPSSRPPIRHGRTVALLLALCLFAAGCRKSPPEGAAQPRSARPSRSESLAGQSRPGQHLGTDSVSGIQALVDTVVARIRRQDTLGLVRLLLDDSAYRRHIYPTSPAFDAASEDAFRFVLAMHKANSAKGLRRVLTDAVKPDSSPAALLRALDSTPAPGGMIYQVRPGDGLRPFGTALCVGSACRIATFAQPGASRTGAGRTPAAALPAGPADDLPSGG